MAPLPKHVNATDSNTTNHQVAAESEWFAMHPTYKAAEWEYSVEKTAAVHFSATFHKKCSTMGSGVRWRVAICGGILQPDPK